MKFRINALLIVSVLMAACSGSQQSAQQAGPTTDTGTLLQYQDIITTDYLEKHLTVFASDSMEGRETGTRGEEMAAEYLVNEYSQLGLEPMGDDSSYFQHFELNGIQPDSVVFKLVRTEDNEQVVVDRSVASKNTSANYIRQFGGADSLGGQVVFAGFGVNDETRNINHLKGVNLQNKWVLVFQEIPNVVEGDTLINPAIDARARFQAIMSQGATGILLIPVASTEEFEEISREVQSDFGKVGSMKLAYRDEGATNSQNPSPGYNIINPRQATQILDLESEDELKKYRSSLIDNITNFTAKELKLELTHIPYTSEQKINSKNVLAYFEGIDPQLKDEVVVLTSHYDHVGIGQPDSTGDRIYNGADDDGSGTIGLLNVAHAFAEAGKNGVKPKRSILFLNVSGEEKGLLGSRYYSDHPVFPIDKTVANLNTDMIGRVDAEHQKKGIEEYVYIIGAEMISSQLDSLISTANMQSGQVQLSKRYNDLQDPNQFYRRSDHWHFGRKGVPFAFFFTGIHEDYHRPSDEVHKIRFEKLAKIVRTIYASAVMIANTDEAPVVDNQEFIEITKNDN